MQPEGYRPRNSQSRLFVSGAAGGPGLRTKPRVTPAIVEIMTFRSGGSTFAIGNVQSRSYASTDESDWKNGVSQRVIRW